MRRSLDGQHRQDAFTGIRAYEAKWVGQKFGWAVDLAASMPAYSSGAVPLASEYEFGLHSVLHTDEKTLSEKELSQWLDVAALWRLCPEAAVGQVRDALAGAIGQECSVVAQMTADDAVVRRILPLLGSLTVEARGDALGASMPWAASPDGRARVSERRRLFGPIWRYYLKHPETDNHTLAGVANSILRSAGQPEMGFRELQGAQAGIADAFTFSGLAKLNPTTARACGAFVDGARRLHNAIASSEPNNGVIADAYGQMNDLWEQSLHVRAVGVLMADAAEQAGCVEQLGRSLTVVIRPRDGSKAQVVVVTS